MALFKPIITNSSKISTVVIKQGQLIFNIDTGGIYIDISDTERKTILESSTIVKWVDDLESLNAIEDKSTNMIYYNKNDNIAYLYNGEQLLPLSRNASTDSPSNVNIDISDTTTDVSQLTSGILSIDDIKYAIKGNLSSIMVDSTITLEQELIDLKAEFEQEENKS